MKSKTQTEKIQLQSKLAKGDKGLFEAVDGAYYATVLWVKGETACLKYYIRGTGCVSYLPKSQWDQMTIENSLDKQAFAQLRYDSYYENI